MGLRDEIVRTARSYGEGRIDTEEFQLRLGRLDRVLTAMGHKSHEELLNSIRLLVYETGGEYGFRTERGLRNSILLLLDGGDPWTDWDKLN